MGRLYTFLALLELEVSLWFIIDLCITTRKHLVEFDRVHEGISMQVGLCVVALQ